MTLTGLEIALLSVIGSLMSGAAGWWLGGRGKVSKSECEEIRKHCDVSAMYRELKGHTQLLRLLCEKNGISVKEQLEIIGNGEAK